MMMLMMTLQSKEGASRATDWALLIPLLTGFKIICSFCDKRTDVGQGLSWRLMYTSPLYCPPLESSFSFRFSLGYCGNFHDQEALPKLDILIFHMSPLVKLQNIFCYRIIEVKLRIKEGMQGKTSWTRLRLAEPLCTFILLQFCNCFQVHLTVSPAGPEGYPRVLDYSIFFSLLVPYSKNFLLARVVE